MVELAWHTCTTHPSYVEGMNTSRKSLSVLRSIGGGSEFANSTVEYQDQHVIRLRGNSFDPIPHVPHTMIGSELIDCSRNPHRLWQRENVQRENVRSDGSAHYFEVTYPVGAILSIGFSFNATINLSSDDGPVSIIFRGDCGQHANTVGLDTGTWGCWVSTCVDKELFDTISPLISTEYHKEYHKEYHTLGCGYSRELNRIFYTMNGVEIHAICTSNHFTELRWAKRCMTLKTDQSVSVNLGLRPFIL